MKVDSAVTDVGWGVGGGLHSNLSFPIYYYFCFMIDHLFSVSFFLISFADLAPNSPINRFFELIFLLYPTLSLGLL